MSGERMALLVAAVSRLIIGCGVFSGAKYQPGKARIEQLSEQGLVYQQEQIARYNLPR